MKLSARNQLRGTVVSVVRGGVITASITIEAVDDLGLAPNDAVTALVKSSDVIIGK